ncbi:hypothetical protein [Iningainema tapete]|uniref:Uncharacterized protein n=1 Tax=Iningainema tapete BLCC-T55 TaxID=2748662 RepID=A0A8J6XEC9_9CYAN|nr:hypothetical protein [Iningainema tapete]MBD2772148.1 hypothetical protein [Iningainema tapete BLCC-T55]
MKNQTTPGIITIGACCSNKRTPETIIIRCTAPQNNHHALLLANPFLITNPSQKEAVTRAYKQWLWINMKNREQYIPLEGWTKRGLTVAPDYTARSAKYVWQTFSHTLWLHNKGEDIELICDQPDIAETIRSALLWLSYPKNLNFKWLADKAQDARI